MLTLTTRPRIPVVTLFRAAGKATGAKMRSLGLLTESRDWMARAEVCERCPLRVSKCGVSYCGTPFAQLIDRDPVTQGCGCPTRAKAKDPKEHCPITLRHRAATRDGAKCDCKWCSRNTN